MRQHVNPLSKQFKLFEPIPPLELIFGNPFLPLHIDIGCASGKFLFDLALQNKHWNYLGIEIREKLVVKAKLKLTNIELDNLNFIYGNAEYLIQESIDKFPKDIVHSISFNFPDPWFKKKHYKRRLLKPEFLNQISKIMINSSLLYIKSDVKELFEDMNSIILDSSIFDKYNLELNNSFNPDSLITERELYVSSKNLPVFQQIYQKILSN